MENSTAGEATEEMVGANPQNRRRKPQNKRKPQAGRLPDFLISGLRKVALPFSTTSSGGTRTSRPLSGKRYTFSTCPISGGE